MTVKLQNGNVILKDGKVSCSCCPTPEPQECCMYPAQALGDAEYAYDDLPDAIEVFEENVFNSFTRSGNFYYSDDAIGPYPAGNYRVRLFDTGVPWVPGTEDYQYNWRLEQFDGVSWSRPEDVEDWQCLIEGLPEDLRRTHDQFADTYTVSGDGDSFTVTVTRVSLCIWTGEDGCGNTAYLVYGDDVSLPFAGADHKWSVALPIYNVSTLQCDSFIGLTINGKERQNTPVGVYESIPGQPLGQTITVS